MSYEAKMIISSDKEYQATKLIKQGKEVLAAPFNELAQWISSTWNVTVLNVIYDHTDLCCRPRLQVILELEKDAWTFRDGVNYDKQKQKHIIDEFRNIISRDKIQGFDVDNLFVVFSAFEPIAKEEADSQIHEEEIAALKNRIDNPDIWEISRCFGHVTFFFFTDDQVKRYEAEGKRDIYARMYFDLLKPHDEFGYLSEEEFKIKFDSKQNFDDNYRGNWFYYYR